MLKPFEAITEPDPRCAGPFGTSLREHYDDIARIDLPEKAAPEVQTIFARARHVFLYAWFDYELTALAEQQALAALEVALRDVLGVSGTLYPLTEQAIARGLLPPTLGTTPLPTVLATMRNTWAHGSSNFGTPGMALTIITLCADLIRAAYAVEPG